MCMDTVKDFGCYVLSDEKLKKYLSAREYKKFLSCKEHFDALPLQLADSIARAIRVWATSLGATHYTHWFFPLSNKSAEKQVSFLDTDKGKIISTLCGSHLIKGEVDASSFPSGSTRMTFEARGYTVWDYSSPIFIKEDNNGYKVVYIPTAFCTYDGVAVDEKTPLLRSCEWLSREGVQLLHSLGYKKVKQILSFVGSEQEYFLLDETLSKQRKDLMITGRTLLGAECILKQEEYQHYLGVISPKVSGYMHDVYQQLCKVGILAKLQHNEVAFSQHEIVPQYATTNVTCDQNMLLMIICKQVAEKHGLAVLFHEKPFAYINGSGKHNNWSIGTDTGLNLFDESKNDPALFMLLFSCVIAGIDKYHNLLKTSVFSASNCLRLGGHEAPPGIISVYIGNDLQERIRQYTEEGATNFAPKELVDTKTSRLYKIEKDSCDRNRTSPFAYTGSKFEFRMVGSGQNIAFCNTLLNSILAHELRLVNNAIRECKDIKSCIFDITKRNFIKHSRIIFNGNGYDKWWQEESANRGLVSDNNVKNIFGVLLDNDTKRLLTLSGIMSETELTIRYNTYLEKYASQIETEARVMQAMMTTQVIPKIEEYLSFLSGLSRGLDDIKTPTCVKQKRKYIYTSLCRLQNQTTKLSMFLKEMEGYDREEKITYIKKNILKSMTTIRKLYDKLESILPQEFLPFPTYNDLLFSLDN